MLSRAPSLTCSGPARCFIFGATCRDECCWLPSSADPYQHQVIVYHDPVLRQFCPVLGSLIACSIHMKAVLRPWVGYGWQVAYAWYGYWQTASFLLLTVLHPLPVKFPGAGAPPRVNAYYSSPTKFINLCPKVTACIALLPALQSRRGQRLLSARISLPQFTQPSSFLYFLCASNHRHATNGEANTTFAEQYALRTPSAIYILSDANYHANALHQAPKTIFLPYPTQVCYYTDVVLPLFLGPLSMIMPLPLLICSCLPAGIYYRGAS